MYAIKHTADKNEQMETSNCDIMFLGVLHNKTNKSFTL